MIFTHSYFKEETINKLYNSLLLNVKDIRDINYILHDSYL